MSVKILCEQIGDDMAVLYDSVYEKPFGLLIHGDKQNSSQEVAEDFLAWADYNGVLSSLNDTTFSDLWMEYQQALTNFKWPLPEEEY